MRELVIGADGFVGRHLIDMTGAEGTSRGNPIYHHHHLLDLLDFREDQLPEADVVYICAGANGAKACEGNSESYRVNVDATIRLAQHYVSHGTFVVWISSSTVEWSNSAYARQKSLAETALRTMPNVGVVRAGRVVNDNVQDLCKTLMEVGRTKAEGVTLWGDERPYEK